MAESSLPPYLAQWSGLFYITMIEFHLWFLKTRLNTSHYHLELKGNSKNIVRTVFKTGSLSLFYSVVIKILPNKYALLAIHKNTIVLIL